MPYDEYGENDGWEESDATTPDCRLRWSTCSHGGLGRAKASSPELHRAISSRNDIQWRRLKGGIRGEEANKSFN